MDISHLTDTSARVLKFKPVTVKMAKTRSEDTIEQLSKETQTSCDSAEHMADALVATQTHTTPGSSRMASCLFQHLKTQKELILCKKLF